MQNCFSTSHYLAKNKKPFTDFTDWLELQELNSPEVQKGYRTNRAAAIFIYYIAEQIKGPLKESLLKPNITLFHKTVVQT